MEVVDLQQLLKKADFEGADLRGIDLRRANLRRANLRRANLERANLEDVNLRWADLRWVNLRGANLRGANLEGADLRWANFKGANLRGANLRGVDLWDTDLRDTDMEGADLYYPIACPEKGSFTGWKKARGYIIELEVLENAKRSSATGRKCRCDKAKVLSITTLEGSDCGLKKIRSNFDIDFLYEVGKTVTVNDFDDNRWAECAPGIHFFITRQEAVNY